MSDLHTFTAENLPTALRDFSLSDTESDSRHLVHLLGSTIDQLAPLRVGEPEARDRFDRAMAFLWVANDLAETLHWKLERLDAEQPHHGKGL